MYNPDCNPQIFFLLFAGINAELTVFFFNIFQELPNKESNDSYISSTPTTSVTILEDSSNNMTYECYENATIYNSYIENSTFWIEGILLIGVGLLGLCGNFLTLAVLGKSKRSTFNQLLIVLSICDSLLIIFFIMMSACTTGRSKTWNIINTVADFA